MSLLGALLAASVSAAGTGCAVHQECGHCLDATDDDNDSCFCAPHRSLELIGRGLLTKEACVVARRVLLDPFVPGRQPFDNRATRGEDLQRLCRLRPRQGNLRLPPERVRLVRRLRHRLASQLCVDAQRHDDHHDPAHLGRRRALQELGGTDARTLHGGRGLRP